MNVGNNPPSSRIMRKHLVSCFAEVVRQQKFGWLDMTEPSLWDGQIGQLLEAPLTSSSLRIWESKNSSYTMSPVDGVTEIMPKSTCSSAPIPPLNSSDRHIKGAAKVFPPLSSADSSPSTKLI